jgi:tRNA modification GTPase
VAAIRIAGPDSLPILQSLFQARGQAGSFQPFLLRYGVLQARNGMLLDEVTAVYMPEGQSYTGLEQAEIFCHGGRQIVRTILEEILKSGARSAEPGEFTKLAFLNGRIDLTKAEAVAEIIAANTAHSYEASRDHLLGGYAKELERLRQAIIDVRAEVEASIDFIEEDIDPAESQKLIEPITRLISDIENLLATYQGGRIINEGFKIVIGGRPNAGKSSLFNLLLRQERALVNPAPGTTRDYLSEWIDLDGFKVDLIDTAGLRISSDEVEQEGQNRARLIMKSANLILWLVDLTEIGWEEQLAGDLAPLSGTNIMLLGNKIDIFDGDTEPYHLLATLKVAPLTASPSISCKSGQGLAELKQRLIMIINRKVPDLTSGVIVTSARHQEKLAAARDAVKEAGSRLRDAESPEIIAFELRRATDALDEITGRIYTEDVLGRIFSSFCIGK